MSVAQRSRRTVFELSSTTKTDPFYERIVGKRGDIGGKGRGVFLLGQKREKTERRKKSRRDTKNDL